MPKPRARGPVVRYSTPPHWTDGAIIDVSVSCGAWIQAVRRYKTQDWLVCSPGETAFYALSSLSDEQVVAMMKKLLENSLRKSLDSLRG
jgi:hypothetical protein